MQGRCGQLFNNTDHCLEGSTAISNRIISVMTLDTGSKYQTCRCYTWVQPKKNNRSCPCASSPQLAVLPRGAESLLNAKRCQALSGISSQVHRFSRAVQHMSCCHSQLVPGYSIFDRFVLLQTTAKITIAYVITFETITRHLGDALLHFQLGRAENEVMMKYDSMLGRVILVPQWRCIVLFVSESKLPLYLVLCQISSFNPVKLCSRGSNQCFKENLYCLLEVLSNCNGWNKSYHCLNV